MFFCTTGGGGASVNPNFYDNWTVCWSLLGTWPDLDWQPAASMLLQLLVSIQAMVFRAEPYTNDPTAEDSGGTKESTEYNRQVNPMTVSFAMLEWLEDAGIWEDVVKLHFKKHSDEILETVAK